MLETFTLDTFAPLKSGTFRVIFDAPAPEIALTLQSVTRLGDENVDPAAPVGRMPFSLLFDGPRTVLLPQRIYRLENDTLGTFEIFLVPVGATPSGFQYEAIYA